MQAFVAVTGQAWLQKLNKDHIKNWGQFFILDNTPKKLRALIGYYIVFLLNPIEAKNYCMRWHEQREFTFW